MERADWERKTGLAWLSLQVSILPHLQITFLQAPDPLLLGVCSGQRDGGMHERTNVQPFPVLEGTPASAPNPAVSDRTQLPLKQEGSGNVQIWRKLIEKFPT